MADVGVAGLFESSAYVRPEYENPSLDYSPPGRSTNCTDYQDVIIRPTIAPSGSSDYQSFRFEIGALDDPYFIDLTTLRLNGILKVVNGMDGNDLTAGDEFSVVNLLPESIWETCKVSINGIPISDHGQGFGFRSYITKHFSYSTQTKITNLIGDYYYDDAFAEDVPPSRKVTSKSKDKEPGYKARIPIAKASKPVHFSFSPCIDLLTTKVAFPSSYILGLEFDRANPHFSILCPDPSKRFSIRVVDIYLEVRRFIPSRSALSKLPSPLKGTFHMPIARTILRRRAVHGGVQDMVLNRICDSTNQMPYSLLIIPLSNTQLSAVDQNPFIFGRNGIKSANLLINGASFPSEPLRFTDDNAILRAYRFFLQVTNR